MQTLKEVIEALRREVADALQSKQAVPGGTRLEADRVVATLQFVIDEKKTGGVKFSVPGAGKRGGAKTTPAIHSLTIEFKTGAQAIGVQSEAAGSAIAPEPRATEMQAERAADVVAQLSSVFGAPGFDSSARATVFREVLEGLSDADATLLADALTGKVLTEQHTNGRRALARLQRICGSGPAGAENGTALLADVLQRNPLPALIKVVRDAWKSQQEWLG